MRLKKNQLNRVPFVMVDATDFATVESTLDAVDINVKLWGLAHGGSVAASAITVSKTPELIRSGIFAITLKATETDAHDAYVLRLSSTSTVSCADQIIMLEMDDVSNSDIHSAVTLIASAVSDIESQVDLNASLASDAHSAATLAASRALVVQSLVSDVDSQLTVTDATLSNLLSDFQSRVPKAVATQSLLSDVHSDLRSQISGIGGGTASNIASVVWNTKYTNASNVKASTFGSMARVIASAVSDIDSALTSQFVWTSNTLSDIQSDLTSQIGGIGAGTVTASDISDIASRVEVVLASRLSDILSGVTTLQSRVTKEVASKSLLSDVRSDLASQIAGVGGGTASNIASVVWSTKYTNASNVKASTFGSMVRVTASAVSDVDSALTSQFNSISNAISDLHSDFQSRVPKEVASKSLLSDVNSDLASKIGGITASISASDISDIASAVEATQASRLSDILSAAQQGASRALVIQSMVSDVDSQLTLTDASVSNILSRVPAVVATSSVQSDIYSLLGTIPTSVSASDMSDIASRVGVVLLDGAAGVESGYTVRQALRIILAACGGKVAGAGTTTITIRDTGDLTNRITATVDADGNRTAVTLDAT